jgi:hypothetical protein
MIMVKDKLYNTCKIVTVPSPNKLYLNSSNRGVNGLINTIHLTLAGITANGKITGVTNMSNRITRVIKFPISRYLAVKTETINPTLREITPTHSTASGKASNIKPKLMVSPLKIR